MKKGTIVVNPYVRETIDGAPNPNHRTIYIGSSGYMSRCLAYTGEIKCFYDDISKWETDGYVDLSAELRKWFGLEETK